MLDPLAGNPDMAQWLASGGDAPVAARHIVHLVSEDPDRLTVADARALGMADLILHAPDTPPAILGRARADAVRQLATPDTPWPTGQAGLTVRIEFTAL
jgi:uroporphyrin-III C-methyltransferase/precorrin-2 dehydrogenase/sirohydrochlorin ferrochelatase